MTKIKKDPVIYYNPENRWSGMPDRDRYVNTPYIPTAFELRIMHFVQQLFDCFCNKND